MKSCRFALSPQRSRRVTELQLVLTSRRAPNRHCLPTLACDRRSPFGRTLVLGLHLPSPFVTRGPFPQIERFTQPAPGLRVVIPPTGFRQETVSAGVFAGAWHALVGSWTVGVVRTGRPFPTVALSAPFWAAGAQLASSSLLPSIEARRCFRLGPWYPHDCLPS